MQMSPSTEKRIDSEYYVEGYATTFNDPYTMYEIDSVQYKEQIDRRALVGADMSDVILQYDHAGKVMARKSNGTLIVEATERGLFVAADLSKSDASRSLYEEIRNGLVTQMSWAFTVDEDEYDRANHTRTIKRVRKVYDVSAVSIPANPSADIAARSFFAGVAEREAQELRERQKRKLKLKLEASQ